MLDAGYEIQDAGYKKIVQLYKISSIYRVHPESIIVLKKSPAEDSRASQ
jgi:hypothetical protein